MILHMPGTAPALLSKAALSDRADAFLPEYREIIGSILPEAGFGGIWESEMFLFYAAVKPFAPKQILESGRMLSSATTRSSNAFKAWITSAIPAQIRSGATGFLHACLGRCHFLTGKYEFDCFSRRGECF